MALAANRAAHAWGSYLRTGASCWHRTAMRCWA